MFRVVASGIEFHGAPTTANERYYLRDAGFVHVTGLWSPPSGHWIGGTLQEEDLGTWEQDADLIVLVTAGGEVWVIPRAFANYPNGGLLAQFAPKGKSERRSPVIRGNLPESRQLLFRAADPSWGILVREKVA